MGLGRMYWDSVNSKNVACIVSSNDFANEAWLLMQRYRLEQLVVVDSQGVIGYITREILANVPEQVRLESDVRDFVTPVL